MEKEFTTLYDTFGTPIYEGDIVEYFHSCHASEGIYIEGKYEDELEKLNESFFENAIKNGYTQKHEWNMVNGTKCVLMHKPCKGIVKWNPEFVTYEPVVNEQDGFSNNSFHYVISACKEDKGTYCKVIGNIFEN